MALRNPKPATSIDAKGTFFQRIFNNWNSEAAPAAIDLCSGMGGLSWAAKTLGMKIVAGVDLNSDALKTFSKNFPDAKALEGSVRSSKVLKECDELLAEFRNKNVPTVILSGPPCQGFSVAGSCDPSDRRNQVLIGVAEAIVKLQPSCALIENVSMLLSEIHENRLAKFENIIIQGGYFLTKVLLDASEFGVSQKRKRAFFFVTRKEFSEEVILDQLKSYKLPVKTSSEALKGLDSPIVRPDDYDDEKDYGLIANHVAMQHSEKVMKKIALIVPGTGPMSYRRLHPEQPSNTLFSGHRAPPAHFEEPRSITVREAARLQGFPDDFRIYGSFGNQMQQVTNAVPPPLAQVVLRVLSNLVGLPIKRYVRS
jgi:DNA (cytosine-5)-methyltransferase 1